MGENTLLKYFFSSGADLDPEDRFHLNRKTRMRRLKEIYSILQKHHYLKGFTPEEFRAMLAKNNLILPGDPGFVMP